MEVTYYHKSLKMLIKYAFKQFALTSYATAKLTSKETGAIFSWVFYSEFKDNKGQSRWPYKLFCIGNTKTITTSCNIMLHLED